jgi:hypothetical protein
MCGGTLEELRWHPIAAPPCCDVHVVTSLAQFLCLINRNTKRATERSIGTGECDNLKDPHKSARCLSVAHGKCIVLYISANTRACCYNRSATDPYAPKYSGTRPNPSSIVDPNCSVIELERWGESIVATGTQEGGLRNTYVASQMDRFEVKQPGVLTNPAVVADEQLPWPQHANSMAY